MSVGDGLASLIKKENVRDELSGHFPFPIYQSPITFLSITYFSKLVQWIREMNIQKFTSATGELKTTY